MAISEFEEMRGSKALEPFLARHRPPAHIRHEVDLAYRLENQSVEVFEIRVIPGASKKVETPIAKATYVKSQKAGKV
jgi:hypothetical protein